MISIYFNLLQNIFREVFLPQRICLASKSSYLSEHNFFIDLCTWNKISEYVCMYVFIHLQKRDPLIGFLFIAILLIWRCTFTLSWGNIDYEKCFDNEIMAFLRTLSLNFDLAINSYLADCFFFTLAANSKILGGTGFQVIASLKVWIWKVAQIKLVELVHCNFHLHYHASKNEILMWKKVLVKVQRLNVCKVTLLTLTL